jgi:hypothetical protein
MKRTNSFYGPSKRVFTAGEWLFSKLRGGAPAFNPASLNPVVWYDPSDLSTLFQDSAGTIPVTAAGQAVGLMRDKSGNNYHASQATSTERPLLQTDGTHWWLQGDGLDDFMQTGNIDLTATDKVSVFAGVSRPSNNSRMWVELGNDANGGFYVFNDNQLRVINEIGVKQADAGTFYTNNTLSEPSNLVSASVKISYAGTSSPVSLRRNAVNIPMQSTVGPAGVFGNLPLYLLSRGGTSAFNSGNLYPLIIVPRLTTDEETSNTEKWVAEKTGVTLPTFVARYDYSTPASGTIPTAGQLIHSDNVINKWNISRTDLDGNVITGDFLENGDTMVLNGVTYTLEAEQFFTDYIALTIEPTTQQPDGTYTIGVYT